MEFITGGENNEKDQWDASRVGGDPAGSQEFPARAEISLPVQELTEKTHGCRKDGVDHENENFQNKNLFPDLPELFKRCSQRS